ncbi:MAG TPA: DUF389 domain-containing protein [Thermoanaerobaculaceae bacterium]|nr:DUF389 domain-containing protein [Thermoanaerobaculaceae bacterium]HRS15919.1 DUF389 domain-containing protein [Thermoanaerobaculaceae bacterium]
MDQPHATSRIRMALVEWWRHHKAAVDQPAVVAQVAADAPPNHTYVVLIVGSAAIASLGLLLDSAAVIIGAMLVAPFLGPIVALGFSIAMTDVTLAVRASKSLLVGVVLGLVTAIVIVKLSPFIPPTAQIMLRTAPNLFDLLVAIFSGFVGGYAVIHRLGNTIAGVAIATALMPPLAASGYGLAMGELGIFNGAFYLFLTNLVAIALAVAATAIWYNFGNLRTTRELLWPTIGAGVVLVLLSMPLVKTLNESVRTTILSRQAGAVLRDALPAGVSRLERLTVQPDGDGTVRVAAVVFAREYDRELQPRLERTLGQELRVPVRLELDQLMLGSDIARTAQPSAAEQAETEARRLRAAVPFPLAVADISAPQRRARLQVSFELTAPLETVKYVEISLRAAFPSWSVELLPPLRPLPPVTFARAETTPDAEGARALAVAVWALARWGAGAVAVSGSAAPDDGPSLRARTALAAQRAEHVAAALAQAGLAVVIEPASAAPPGTQTERGTAALRVARIEPRTGS